MILLLMNVQRGQMLLGVCVVRDDAKLGDQYYQSRLRTLDYGDSGLWVARTVIILRRRIVENYVSTCSVSKIPT